MLALPARSQLLFILFSVLLLIVVLFVVAQVTFAQTVLGDFTVTFYRAAINVLRGENVYFAYYPNSLNGRDYPPYNPIWIVFPALPLTVFPLDTAEVVRFLADLAILPLLAFIAARWANLKHIGIGALLVVAPWHIFFVFSGHYSAVIWIGIVLCYVGITQRRAGWIAVGLFFLILKPHVVALIILATLVYAWRNRILAKSLAGLTGLSLISSLAQPSWLIDVVTLWLERLARPRFADAVLLLPGYPWTQLGILALGVVLLILHWRRSDEKQPTLWLWCVLICVSLLGALHSFPYDWLNLLFPMAWLLNRPHGIWVIIGAYLYTIIWLFAEFIVGIHIPPMTIIPAVLTMLLFVWRLIWRPKYLQASNLSASR